MVEQEIMGSIERILQHSRIIEAHFPRKYNALIRNQRFEEYLSLRYTNFKVCGELEHLEGDVFWGLVNFDAEKELQERPKRGRLNMLSKAHKFTPLGITVREQAEINNRRQNARITRS